MIMTDAGITAIEMSSRGPLHTLMSWLGFGSFSAVDTAREPVGSDHQLVDWEAWSGERARQDALVSAHRALRLAYAGDTGEAETFFACAFSLDQTLKPADLPGFWRLDLQGLEAAGRGLRDAGRHDDARALASEISYRFSNHPSRQPARAAS